MKHSLLLLFFSLHLLAAEPEFPLTADSKPQAEVAKGTLIKDSYTAPESSVFPGTVREYQIYLPAGFDKAQPAHFMVFQDGVIYQAPVVFDNLIAKKDIPSLVGIFIKPGVVPAANDNALPRFNRSYEYDSITPTYSKFLIEEFLPALEKKHAISLSQDPNHAAISGNSSGGICAFMVAWHRPDRFRRVFTGVGTYVGIHGADQLPVLVRKIEPKPLRIYLQSGTGDNNLYCGDWWMANQMMERSLTWAGYDVNHAWGEGGHNQKHASQIFPDVLRWLWRDWQTNIEVKANPKGESKWKGYEVVNESSWHPVVTDLKKTTFIDFYPPLISMADGTVLFTNQGVLMQAKAGEHISPRYEVEVGLGGFPAMTINHHGHLIAVLNDMVCTKTQMISINEKGIFETMPSYFMDNIQSLAITSDDRLFAWGDLGSAGYVCTYRGTEWQVDPLTEQENFGKGRIALSPDQTMLYISGSKSNRVAMGQIQKDQQVRHTDGFVMLDEFGDTPDTEKGLCVDTEGRLYVATSLGIQVCDQAGRVNFIIPTPKPAHDVCFGGKDLSELFIACGDTIYKRPTKVHGVVSGQQAPIKPAPPKL